MLESAGDRSGAVLFSAAPDFYSSAVQEVRRSLRVGSVGSIGPDAGVLELDAGGIVSVAAAVGRHELRFVRHLAAVVGELPTAVLKDEAGEAVLDLVFSDVDPGEAVALQVWESGKSPVSPEAVWHSVADALTASGFQVRRHGCPVVISVCIGERRAVVGVNSAAFSLSDWPGGRARLATSQDQVSRAEFKLEELFGLHPMPAAKVGLDLGASPGGWTRILRKHGCETVHAVDPADLDPAVEADPGVVHHRTTSGEFLKSTPEFFDIVVNDMRMVPELSAQVMVEAADRLRPGATAILTFKLEADDAVDQADRALKIFKRAYDVTFVRQLQHNRHELTVVGRLART